MGERLKKRYIYLVCIRVRQLADRRTTILAAARGCGQPERLEIDTNLLKTAADKAVQEEQTGSLDRSQLGLCARDKGDWIWPADWSSFAHWHTGLEEARLVERTDALDEGRIRGLNRNLSHHDCIATKLSQPSWIRNCDSPSRQHNNDLTSWPVYVAVCSIEVEQILLGPVLFCSVPFCSGRLKIRSFSQGRPDMQPDAVSCWSCILHAAPTALLPTAFLHRSSALPTFIPASTQPRAPAEALPCQGRHEVHNYVIEPLHYAALALPDNPLWDRPTHRAPR
ncbi:uncharacterized protein V1516DRAFT_686026 [Lipomyces oligophaga]|uniref:uncharacterized protein n=1 Tax=Lipomyces oligophaga TaxID=45792 RepID=UPI0034CD90B4